MRDANSYSLHPIGFIRSDLKRLSEAPRQGFEGAPNAVLEICEQYVEALDQIQIGDEILIMTWLHQARRDVLKVHPRDDPSNPLTGVFLMRSSDRPNPIGLHRVEVLEVASDRLTIGPIEAIDGTPVIDIKPVIHPSDR